MRAPPVLLSLSLLLGCPPAEEAPNDPADPATGWPDPSSASAAALTVVHDGEVLADGSVVRFDALRAGEDGEVRVRLQLTNRGGRLLALSPDGADWVESADDGFFLGPPPADLDPDATAVLDVWFTSASATAGGEAIADLAVPGLDDPLRLRLVADVPRPARTLLTGGSGYLAISDDRGQTWTDVVVPATQDTARHQVTWGSGRFLHTFADSTEWQANGVYRWSEDGETWQDSAATDAFWVTDCTWGLDRFLCLRAQEISWSTDGANFIHEANGWDAMLNAVVFAGDRFIAVGRDDRKVTSTDGASWTAETGGAFEDDWADVAFADGLLVAVGGTNRQMVSVSSDLGASWSDQELHASQYASLSGVAWFDGAFWTSGNGTPGFWRSSDGVSWSQVTFGAGGEPRILGVVGGALLVAVSPWQQPGQVFRSEDGENWVSVLTAPGAFSFQDIAIEGTLP